MDNNNLLHKFKKSFPALNSTKVDIQLIEEVPESGTVGSVYFIVTHPFIFDNRLIPKEYNGLEVINAILSSTLPKVFNPEKELPLWEVESPHNYVRFVDDNISLIRKELRNTSMSKLEALNAITRDFGLWLKSWNKLVRDWFLSTSAETNFE